MSLLKRPKPMTGVYERPFWAAAGERKLKLQQCQSCGHTWYPPGPVCPTCLSDEWEFTEMSGRGKLAAWTVFHRQYFPDLPVPYLVASIELDEGPLMIGNVSGLKAEDAKLGLELEVEFEAVRADDGEWQLPQWRIRR